MTHDFAGLSRATWRLFRRDADLLLRIAGALVFLPHYALVLLVPRMPAPEQGFSKSPEAMAAWLDKAQAWMNGYGLGVAIAYLVVYFGVATILALYLSGPDTTVGNATQRAATLFPRFLLAMVVASIPTGAAMWLLLLPGLYLMARFLLSGAAIFAERPIGAVAAIRRSWRMTQPAQWSLLGMIAVIYLSSMLVGQTFLLLGDAMTRSGAVNPVALAITGAGAAAAATIAQLASALVAVVAYRRLAR